ncbi:hypothetical protein NM208_g8827 [Fusarium decemcellulare]|uniref:Uncharacterized protein n=1 Tax=Fusarium decemcellulare TaxID=57161 RepID=A0ACC1S452_9HYPO|nr:hypothetical protein NM208_g8827 [Fusarium decemcellulare]
MATTTSDHEHIRNIIALYSQLLDQKHFEQLGKVLTPDVSLEYPAPLDAFKGIEESQNGLKKAISHPKTIHCLSTQSIHLTGPETAVATTYVMAHHWLGEKTFVSPGKYDDELVKDVFNGENAWRIKRRVVTIMGVPEGDWSLIQ